MAEEEVTERIARMAAELIVAEARATGFGFRPGHHVSTSTTALARTLTMAAEVFITTHMRHKDGGN
mgnify:CR=1 FL=1